MTMTQVEKCVPGTPVILYSDFSKMDSIDDILDKNGQCIFLIQWQPNEGHYCCLWKRQREIHVFDPLGIVHDNELKHVPRKYRKQLKEDRPYLSNLLKKSGCKIFYNTFHLQLKTTSVCGKECIVRLAFKNLNEQQYDNLWCGLQPDAILAELKI